MTYKSGHVRQNMQKFKFSEYGRVIYRWKGNFVLIKNYYECYSQKQTQKKLQTLETI